MYADIHRRPIWPCPWNSDGWRPYIPSDLPTEESGALTGLSLYSERRWTCHRLLSESISPVEESRVCRVNCQCEKTPTEKLLYSLHEKLARLDGLYLERQSMEWGLVKKVQLISWLPCKSSFFIGSLFKEHGGLNSCLAEPGPPVQPSKSTSFPLNEFPPKGSGFLPQ